MGGSSSIDDINRQIEDGFNQTINRIKDDSNKIKDDTINSVQNDVNKIKDSVKNDVNKIKDSIILILINRLIQ